MSRWLWALLGGVVLVAIAAVFWTDTRRMSSPCFAEASSRRSRAGARLPLRRQPRHLRPRRLPPHLRRRPRRRPLPLRRRRLLPLLIRRRMQDSKPPRRLLPRRPLARPRLRPSSLRSLRLLQLRRSPNRPCRRPRPDGRRQEVAGVFAPKNLAQLVGAWAYSEGDCERLFQRRGGGWAYRQPVDKFAQAAIVELPKRILLPSAICRIDGASEAEGALKVSAECEDSISYTSRSVMIALRSPTELIYSASGDPALATTLKKCAP